MSAYQMAAWWVLLWALFIAACAIASRREQRRRGESVPTVREWLGIDETAADEPAPIFDQMCVEAWDREFDGEAS